MQHFGLVLAGGGAKGAYQIGAWRAMRELGFTPDAVAGVSIGAINGALICANAYDAAVSLWNSVSVDKGVNITEELPDPNNLFSVKNLYVLLREFIKNGGIDASPTAELLKKYISEEEVRASSIGFGLVTIQLSRGATPLELTLDKIPEGELIDYLLASAHVPGVSNIGPDGESFLDGGVYDNAPVAFMRRYGYNKLVIVDISSIKGYAHSFDITNSTAVYIRPYDIDELGASFDFDSETNAKRMIIGYLDAKKAFDELSGNIYHFTHEAFSYMLTTYGANECHELEKLAWALKLPRTVVYDADSFLKQVKTLYEERKSERTAKQEEGNAVYSQIKKVVSSLKKEDVESNIIAILDDIIL